MKYRIKSLVLLIGCIFLCVYFFRVASKPAETVEKIKAFNVYDLTVAEAKKQLEEAGFTKITVDSVDQTWDENSYYVVGTSYEIGSLLAADEEVSLYCVRKATVVLDISSEGNQEVSLNYIDDNGDDVFLGMVGNGKSFTDSYTVYQGAYLLKVKLPDNESVVDTYMLIVTDDMTFKAEISASSDTVSFENFEEIHSLSVSGSEELSTDAGEQEGAD